MFSRSYSELITFPTFLERFEYLKLNSRVGDATFGHDRWQNQEFYRSTEWRRARNHVIVRDLGCDLAVPGFEIPDRVVIHHITPITPQDFATSNPSILDPENLITTTHNTHNAIHFGDASLLPQPDVERRPGDTIEW